MINLTEADISGSLQKIQGELGSPLVHRYETVYSPELSGEEIETRYGEIEGVNDVSVRDISEDYPRYEVEVFIEEREVTEKDDYQQILSQTQ
ncbi:MAG: hypothetical protein ABEK16_02135 [Candidatus Nanohalobium sp.]